MDEKLFRNIGNLLYVNLVSMKRAEFAYQGAEWMVQEWFVLWLTQTGWSGEQEPFCAMQGELHGSALHCLAGVSQAPFPDSAPYSASVHPSWYSQKLYNKLLPVFQIPHHLLGIIAVIPK